MGKFAPRSRFCTSQAQGYANPGKRVCSPKGEGLKIARGVCKPARLGLQPLHAVLHILGRRSSYPLTWVCSLACSPVLAPCVCSLGSAVSLDAQVPRACQPQHQEYATWGYSLTTTVVDPGERVCS
ncbi:hypothetical protein D5086_017760 [Populus alba]|uniref:Uncharacterized protein n=1 Tax=Populus alba TaxID=43335 RepID=A0ACC4BNH0_POPAL